MGLTKRGKWILLIVVLFLAVLSTMMMVQLFNNNTNKIIVNNGYDKLFKEALNIEIGQKDLKEISKEYSDKNILLVTNNQANLNSLPFETYIDNDGIHVANPISYLFYDYDFTIGDVITSIDGADLKDLKYEEITALIFQKDNAKIKLKFKSGKEFDYIFKNSFKEFETIYQEGGAVLFKIYNLDRINFYALYQKSTDCQKVILDLSKAKINDKDEMVNFISLLVPANQKLFNDKTSINGTKLIDKDIEIIVSNNQNKGLLFALSIIKDLNSKIIFDCPINKVLNYQVYYLFSNNKYSLFIKHEALNRTGSEAVENLFNQEIW